MSNPPRPISPLSGPAGPVTGSCTGLHLKSGFPAVKLASNIFDFPFLKLMKFFCRHQHCLPIFALLLAAFFCSAMAQQALPAAPPAAPPAAAEEESLPDADLELLGKTAERFVKAFNEKDAAALAALFLPHGEMVGSSGETYSGREAIKAHYTEVFAAEIVPLIALEADSVRLVAPGVVVEDGFIHLTTSDDEPVISVAYSAIHTKQPDGSWLIATNRDQSEFTPPDERIKPLYWLVGEWTLEGEDGLRVDMVIDLDDSGNYLLGESLVTDAAGDSQSTHLRIGWNPATATIYWWTFDSQGGFTAGPWARNGDDWMIATSGFTADAEANSTTQTLTRVRADSMLWTAKDRLLADQTLPDLSLKFVRRAPDPGPLKSGAGAATKAKDSSPTKD